MSWTVRRGSVLTIVYIFVGLWVAFWTFLVVKHRYERRLVANALRFDRIARLADVGAADLLPTTPQAWC